MLEKAHLVSGVEEGGKMSECGRLVKVEAIRVLSGNA